MSQGGTNISGVDTQALFNRVLRVAQLDTSVFEEVKNDAAGTIPSIIVAAVAVVVASLGGLLWWVVNDGNDTGEFLVRSVILGSAFAVALWFAWVGVTYVLLTQIFKATADFQSLVRTMGLAAVPLVLMFLMFVPALDFSLALAAVGLWVTTTTLAVQASTSASPGQTLLATAAGFLVWAVVLGLLAGADTDSAPLAPGIFVFDWLEELIVG
ncbi:MAG TPA: hypothetical protein VIO14_03135 [Dehalococcoidia bacterium]